MTVASKLREARDALRLSRTKLAERTGVSAKVIEKLERGECEPTLKHVKALTPALGLTMDEVMQEVEGDEDVTSAHSDDPIARARRKLEEAAAILGGGPLFDAAAEFGDLPDGGADTPPAPSGSRVLEDLPALVQARGLESRAVRAAVQDAERFLRDQEPEELVALAGRLQVPLQGCADLEELKLLRGTEQDAACGDVVDRLIAIQLYRSAVDLASASTDQLEALVRSTNQVFQELDGDDAIGLFSLSMDKPLPLVSSPADAESFRHLLLIRLAAPLIAALKRGSPVPAPSTEHGV